MPVAKYLKRLVFGRPLASERLEHERLNKVTALAVLSSDAISSVAYATDQILAVLAVLGAMALQFVVPISAVIVGLLVLVTLCAIAGDQLNYFVGRQAGQALYSRPDSFLFKKKHLERAHAFYETYGVKTIIIARFVPIVRTFCPAVAGAARMTYRTYLTFDIIGGVLWVFSTVLGGFFLGRSVPNVNEHLHIVIAAVVFLSLLPAIIEALRHRKSARPPTPVAAVRPLPDEE